jgi:hypothetical protein
MATKANVNLYFIIKFAKNEMSHSLIHSKGRRPLKNYISADVQINLHKNLAALLSIG